MIVSHHSCLVGFGVCGPRRRRLSSVTSIWSFVVRTSMELFLLRKANDDRRLSIGASQARHEDCRATRPLIRMAKVESGAKRSSRRACPTGASRAVRCERSAAAAGRRTRLSRLRILSHPSTRTTPSGVAKWTKLLAANTADRPYRLASPGPAPVAITTREATSAPWLATHRNSSASSTRARTAGSVHTFDTNSNSLLLRVISPLFLPTAGLR